MREKRSQAYFLTESFFELHKALGNVWWLTEASRRGKMSERAQSKSDKSANPYRWPTSLGVSPSIMSTLLDMIVWQKIANYGPKSATGVGFQGMSFARKDHFQVGDNKPAEQKRLECSGSDNRPIENRKCSKRKCYSVHFPYNVAQRLIDLRWRWLLQPKLPRLSRGNCRHFLWRGSPFFCVRKIKMAQTQPLLECTDQLHLILEVSLVTITCRSHPAFFFCRW